MTDLVHFEDVGRGPAVLLLHGCPSKSAHFAPLVEALAPTHRVLVADLPGYGESAALAPYSLDAATERLASLLVDRAVTELAVVGHSLGGYRALALALEPRLRVRTVVTLGGFAEMPPEVRAGYRGAAQLARRSLDELADALMPAAFATGYAEAHPSDAREVRSWIVDAPRETLVAELEALADLPDLRPRLGRLTTRLVVRVGAGDLIAPPARSEEVVRAAPRATLEIVPGCGHTLLLEDRDATVAAVVAAVG